MIYKQSTIDIVEDVVNAMVFPVEIKGIATSGTQHTLTVCNIYHAQPGFNVTIDNKKYLIKSISAPDTIVVQGSPAITATSFNLYPPFFFHGTPIQQGMELNQITKAFDKTPMVWFHEQFTDRFIEDALVAMERESRIRLFFLTQADYEKWLTDDTYHNAIEPMRRLAENFIDELKVYRVGCEKRFNTDDLEFELINYHRFGVFISNRGMEKSLWADKLAGVELAITLPVFKINPCDEC